MEQPKKKKQHKKDIFVGCVGTTVDKTILVGKYWNSLVLVEELLVTAAAPALLWGPGPSSKPPAAVRVSETQLLRVYHIIMHYSLLFQGNSKKTYIYCSGLIPPETLYLANRMQDMDNEEMCNTLWPMWRKYQVLSREGLWQIRCLRAPQIHHTPGCFFQGHQSLHVYWLPSPCRAGESKPSLPLFSTVNK